MLKHSATDYPVEGVDKPPTIHKRQRIHQIPAVPLSKENDDDNDNRTATGLITITTATSNGYIVRLRALNSPHQHKKTELTDNDSAPATRHITAPCHSSSLLP